MSHMQCRVVERTGRSGQHARELVKTHEVAIVGRRIIFGFSSVGEQGVNLLLVINLS
jgi:hypothetical protein